MEPGSPPPPPPPPPPTTTLLGKYQLGRLLGRGSFAKVHWAKSITDNTPVAIKIIDKTKTVDTAMEPRIIREVAAMRRLHHHPNILKLHEVMATKTKIYLVMELASGGELFAKVLRRGRLSEPVARKYLQQLVSALHFCHQNGVSHRDVKPQNLLLDHNGNVKVSDFGLSALPEQRKNGLLHTACGTPAYAAPEVVSRRGYDGSKADAWSCGVLLFVFLVGCLPFDDNNIIAMYKRIHKREYQIPASVSKPARAVIYQLLDPNPNTRMSIEGLMENKWFKKSLLARQETGFVMEGLKDCGTFNMVPGLGMNAFDIISLSSGLDLSGLFEVTSRKEKRFTTKVPVEGVMERLREVGGKLGYRVEGVKGGGVGLGKERVVLVVEVLEITTELLLVEVKVVEGGVEFEESCWEELREGFGDIVLSWHNGMLCEV